MISLYRNQVSWFHKIPTALKLILLLASSALLFPIQLGTIQLFVFISILALYFSLGHQGLNHVKVLAPLKWLLAAVFLLQWWTIDLNAAVALTTRMANMILLANLVTLTTRMEDMIATIRPCFIPLRIFGANPDRIAFAISLFIRFIPVLMETMNYLTEAWKARGGNYQRWKLIVPMMLSTLKMSDSVSEALFARGGITRQPRNMAE